MNPSAGVANFTTPNGGTNGLEWPLVGGWLLVEAKWSADEKWHGVTQEWLSLGFARGVNVPTQPGFTCAAAQYNANGYDAATNSLATGKGCNSLGDHKNAILYFQYTKDSNLTGAPSTAADYPSDRRWHLLGFRQLRDQSTGFMQVAVQLVPHQLLRCPRGRKQR